MDLVTLVTLSIWRKSLPRLSPIKSDCEPSAPFLMSVSSAVMSPVLMFSRGFFNLIVRVSVSLNAVSMFSVLVVVVLSANFYLPLIVKV